MLAQAWVEDWDCQAPRYRAHLKGLVVGNGGGKAASQRSSDNVTQPTRLPSSSCASSSANLRARRHLSNCRLHRRAGGISAVLDDRRIIAGLHRIQQRNTRSVWARCDLMASRHVVTALLWHQTQTRQFTRERMLQLRRYGRL